MTQKIRRLPGFPLHIASWGTEFAVYHEGSGNTHLLDEYAYAVLKILENGAQDISSVVRQCAEFLHIEFDWDFDQHIREVVRHLVKHDLVEVVL